MFTKIPPLVDRVAEMARIERALEAPLRGEGGLLCLRGEAGVGKTRLAQEAVELAARLGFTVGFAAALSESGRTYHPWTDALHQVGLESLLDDAPPPKLLALVAFGSRAKVVAKVEREEITEGDLGESHRRLTQFARESQRTGGQHEGGEVAVEAIEPHRLR